MQHDRRTAAPHDSTCLDSLSLLKNNSGEILHVCKRGPLIYPHMNVYSYADNDGLSV
jgi:hypothetical protein